MSEAPKVPAPEADDDDKAVGYAAKFIRTSKLKELFVEEGTNIRISGEAKAEVWKFLDECVAKGVKEILSKMPRNSKGDNKGKLKRITIMKEDLTGAPAPPN